VLQKLRSRVGERISLPDPPTPQPEEDVEGILSKETTVGPALEQDQQKPEQSKEEDVKMEEVESSVKKEPSPLESQPLQQTDTFMTDDANLDVENFNDFPTIGEQDQDINMDTS